MRQKPFQMERFLNIDNLLFYIKQIDDFQKMTFIF